MAHFSSCLKGYHTFHSVWSCTYLLYLLRHGHQVHLVHFVGAVRVHQLVAARGTLCLHQLHWKCSQKVHVTSITCVVFGQGYSALQDYITVCHGQEVPVGDCYGVALLASTHHHYSSITWTRIWTLIGVVSYQSFKVLICHFPVAMNILALSCTRS